MIRSFRTLIFTPKKKNGGNKKEEFVVNVLFLFIFYIYIVPSNATTGVESVGKETKCLALV